MALLFDNDLLRHTHMRLDGLGINSRKERIHFRPNLDMLDSALGEDAREHAASGAVHRIDQELETGRADLVEIGELFDGLDVWSFEIRVPDSSLFRTHRKRLV